MTKKVTNPIEIAARHLWQDRHRGTVKKVKLEDWHSLSTSTRRRYKKLVIKTIETVLETG